MDSRMGTESELKFQISDRLPAPSRWGISKADIGPESHSRLLTTYFDTRKSELQRRGLSLRVRKNGGDFVQTIKARSTSSVGRGEWETEAKGGALDLRKPKDSPLR